VKQFHACDGIGKVELFYPAHKKENVFFSIFVEKAFFEDAEKFVFKSFTVKKQIRPTGDRNTGSRNTGSRNTGDWNTGDWNTGSSNTGSRNLTNFSSGFFAIEEPKAFCFGKPTEYTHTQFVEKFNDIIIQEPCFDNLMKLPNADEETVKRYLEKYESLNGKKI
jgi:hypothetical protein